MIKIKTLFKRDIIDHKIVDIHPDIVDGCEWVLNEPCIATRKMDGTASAIINGMLYARLDFKNLKSKQLPSGAIACQPLPDPITGSHPFWVPVVKDGINILNACRFRTKEAVIDMQYKYHYKAFKRLIQENQDIIDKTMSLSSLDGTYELCGKHIKGNPEQLEIDTLIKHGSIVLEDVPKTFDGIREYLRTHYIEGIVFYRNNGGMAKIKRSDFGFEWIGHQERRVQNKSSRHRKRYYK